MVQESGQKVGRSKPAQGGPASPREPETSPPIPSPNPAFFPCTQLCPPLCSASWGSSLLLWWRCYWICEHLAASREPGRRGKGKRVGREEGYGGRVGEERVDGGRRERGGRRKEGRKGRKGRKGIKILWPPDYLILSRVLLMITKRDRTRHNCYLVFVQQQHLGPL